MANTLKNLGNLFADVKTRTIFLVTGGILLTAIIVGVIGFSRSGNQGQAASTVIGPGNITSIPGTANVSPQVAQVQSSLNTQRYNQALEQGKSAMPSVIGVGGTGSTKSDVFFASNTPTTTTTKPKNSGIENGTVIQTASSTAAEEQAAAQKTVASQNTLSTQDEQARQQAQQKLTDGMTSQAKAALAAWGGGQSGTPTQTYVGSSSSLDKNANGTTGTTSTTGTANTPSTSSTKAPKGPAVIKAGDVMFALLTTAVNSDEPGPVMAVIVGGDYKGSKLVGGLDQPQAITGTNGPFGVTLRFRTMNIPEETNSISITAVAIDPDTARTALANDVDHHYLYRYGSLFASSFLEGYGNAIQSSGSVTVNNTDGSSTQFNQQLNPKQTFLAALGEVGQQWGQQLGDSFNRPNTITVNPGISIGILFLADVTLDETSFEPIEPIKAPNVMAASPMKKP